MISLLPTNTTRLERALDLASAAEPRVADGLRAVSRAKLTDIPDALIPWLLWEYGLGELLPYLPDPRVAIRDGVLWQRIRGTPRSLQIAYSWRGLERVVVEEEQIGRAFAEFQIGTGAVPSPGAVDDLIVLSRLAAPVRSLLSLRPVAKRLGRSALELLRRPLRSEPPLRAQQPLPLLRPRHRARRSRERGAGGRRRHRALSRRAGQLRRPRHPRRLALRRALVGPEPPALARASVLVYGDQPPRNGGRSGGAGNAAAHLPAV